ncbi:MAG: exodeoxyribonuclease V subunit beta [Verrucomicrobiota bacterium]|nr:exodeoxyribonuclease V subunit beta [Verrucomicrobiota bacterium]
MKAFDAITTPLETGFTLIEASAGTGKTTTITAIVLRLIVEDGLALENILVTTYTELATAELRGRIRDVLSAALEILRGGKPDNQIASSVIALVNDRPSAKRRIEHALRTFDDAAIFTIHGFCAHVLADRAFESGALFETELLADATPILREATEDFWRRETYDASPMIAALLKENLSVASLQKLLEECSANPTLQLLSEIEDDAALRREIEAKWSALADCYQNDAAKISRVFANLNWAKPTNDFHERVRAAVTLLARNFAAKAAFGEISKALALLSMSRLEKQKYKDAAISPHAFFKSCEELVALVSRYVIALQQRFMVWAKTEVRRRKVARQVQSFDDMLTQLDGALSGERGEVLRETLRTRFPAALIDEFQDTDPVQYAIFSKIYERGDARVFFIGDPKQSIYGFRGADVFTYLSAARRANRKYSLPRNWRSEAKLVGAVNEMFGVRPDAFAIEGIDFEPVTAAGKADEATLTIDKQRDQPMRIWLAPNDDSRDIGGAVAGEIARLLRANARIGEEKIVPSDIAVLVYTNWQPAEVQKALARFRIPTVVYSAENVFRSREARELRRILAAVAEPTRDRLVRAALATEALGLRASELEKLATEESAWERRVNRFADYHALWRDGSFVEMMSALFVREKVRARLLGYVDGERRLTNFLHLIELLHRACAENRLGLDGLVLWLAREMADDKRGREEYEVRLESDDAAVKIVTVHKSKGLEYPITFCPFAWRDPNTKGPIKFHRGDDFLLDLEKRKENVTQQRREVLSEAVRQFYVALTRAKHRTYLVWTNDKSKSKSAPAFLVSGAPVEEMEKGVAAETVTASFTAQFAASANIVVEPMPAKVTANVSRPDLNAATLAPRVFSGEIDRSWGVVSFTSLVNGRKEEAPDYDAVESVLADDAPVASEGIHAFPGGTRAGTCLHLILEKLDFTAPEQLQPTVSEQLRLFRIEQFDEVVSETIRQTLALPLDESGMTLSHIASASRISELEFTLPVTGLTNTRLREVFAEESLAVERLQFPLANGFIKGFVDLIFEHDGRFYIADWKSNWLGPSLASYTPESIAAAMAHRFYELQASIYAVALHRYLRARLPDYDCDRHFGGAFYIFLRGVEAGEASKAVFHRKPPRAFIEKLDGIFHGGD